MMVLIVGGSGSGKSSYAEETAVSLFKTETSFNINMKKYYLATMQIFDEEGQQKVDRHRKLRSGKDFLTIEQQTNIHKALEKMETGKHTVLLECISNLAANEMFSKEPKSETQVFKNITTGIEILKENTAHLVIVTNNVFEDGIDYDKLTMAYIRAMGKINESLAALADKVIEVIAGIPIIIKQ